MRLSEPMAIFPETHAAPRALLRWALPTLPLATAACAPGVLDPRGPVGAAESLLLINSLGIMLAIVVPTIVATLGIAWWFRASNGKARYLPNWSFSGRIELVVWAIPLMTILLLGGVAWVGSYALDPAVRLTSGTPASQAAAAMSLRAGGALKPALPALEVQAVSLDWKWLFIYPAQGVASVNRLVVPAGRPLHFRLTSASVLNTFFIPQLGSMVYAMNGMSGELNLQADRPGRYRGLSAHYSGAGFSDMRFDVEAVSDAEFEAWAGAAKRDTATVLDTTAYNALAKPSIAVPPSRYGAVEPGLYERIVMREIAPAPGREPPGAEGSASAVPSNRAGKP